jgi:hypothetical protein
VSDADVRLGVARSQLLARARRILYAQMRARQVVERLRKRQEQAIGH